MAHESFNKHRLQGHLFLIGFIIILVFSNLSYGARSSLNKKKPTSKTFRSMARVYAALGDYKNAQKFGEKALSIAKEKNDQDQELSSCMIDLSWVYQKQGKYNKAEQMCSHGLSLQKKTFDENHPYVAYTLRTLSSIYQQQGRYHQAMPLLER
ncbi:MAG: tetratricopeptide repeat protein, partial [Planctomycetota bacterium]